MSELVLDLNQLRPQTLLDRDAPDPEPSGRGLRADVREAQEVERLRFTQTPPSTVPSSEPPELDQPRLVRVQLQPEVRQPLAKLGQEPPRILLVLKPDGVVVSEPHDDHVTVRPVTPPPVGPQIEHVVQVHVREQRRYRCPLR
jgi:hypothetical protein